MAGWIGGAIKHPGALHRALGVPQGKKIPGDKLEAARNSKIPRIRRMASLAHTLGGIGHNVRNMLHAKHARKKG